MADEEYEADDAGAEYDDIAEEDDNIEETEEQEEDGCVLLILYRLLYIKAVACTWHAASNRKQFYGPGLSFDLKSLS